MTVFNPKWPSLGIRKKTPGTLHFGGHFSPFLPVNRSKLEIFEKFEKALQILPLGCPVTHWLRCKCFQKKTPGVHIHHTYYILHTTCRLYSEGFFKNLHKNARCYIHTDAHLPLHSIVKVFSKTFTKTPGVPYTQTHTYLSIL